MNIDLDLNSTDSLSNESLRRRKARTLQNNYPNFISKVSKYLSKHIFFKSSLLCRLLTDKSKITYAKTKYIYLLKYIRISSKIPEMEKQIFDLTKMMRTTLKKQLNFQ